METLRAYTAAFQAQFGPVYIDLARDTLVLDDAVASILGLIGCTQISLWKSAEGAVPEGIYDIGNLYKSLKNVALHGEISPIHFHGESPHSKLHCQLAQFEALESIKVCQHSFLS